MLWTTALMPWLVLTQGYPSFGLQGPHFLKTSSQAWDSPQTSIPAGWLNPGVPASAHTVPGAAIALSAKQPWSSPLDEPTGLPDFRSQGEGALVSVLCFLEAPGFLGPELCTPGRPSLLSNPHLENGSPLSFHCKTKGPPSDSNRPRSTPRCPSVSTCSKKSSWERFPLY